MPGVGFNFTTEAQIGASGLTDSSGNPTSSGQVQSGVGAGGSPPPLSGCYSTFKDMLNLSGIKACFGADGYQAQPYLTCYSPPSKLHSGQSFCCSGVCANSVLVATFSQTYDDGVTWSVPVSCTYDPCRHQWIGTSIVPPADFGGGTKMICIKCTTGLSADYSSQKIGGYTVPVGSGFYNSDAGCGGYLIGWQDLGPNTLSGCCICWLTSCFRAVPSLPGPCSCNPLMYTWKGCTMGGHNCNKPYYILQVSLTQ
jgi:hypothetical protein